MPEDEKEVIRKRSSDTYYRMKSKGYIKDE